MAHVNAAVSQTISKPHLTGTKRLRMGMIVVGLAWLAKITSESQRQSKEQGREGIVVDMF